MTLDISTPVLVLGGKENSLSLARHLGRRGIQIKVSGPDVCWGMYSRYCQQSFSIPRGQSSENFWKQLLLCDGDDSLFGHIILPCSDEAIEFIAQNRSQLEQHYILDGVTAKQQLDLLDKQKTLQLARDAEVSAPDYWQFANLSDYEKIRENVTFPVMVKPLHSHKFTRVFGCKLFIIQKSFDELLEKLRLASAQDIEVIVTEMIPGPDSLISSYITYVDRDGQYLFDFTKRILRSFPVNRGNGCHHITEWLPETAEQGRKFFKNTGFRGLGNIEFKRDIRDGKLKIIEVNGRFSGSLEMLIRSGIPADLINYCYLTDQPLPEFGEFQQPLTLWYPFRDFLTMLKLRKQGALSLGDWLKSIMRYKKISPLFDLRDPIPIAGALAANLQKLRK